MKQILLAFSLITTVLFASCGDTQVMNPSTKVGDKNPNSEFYFQVDSTIYKVKFIYFGGGNGGIYVVVPKDANVTVPQTITFKQGKSTTAAVKIDR